jgi:hypothetical protein
VEGLPAEIEEDQPEQKQKNGQQIVVGDQGHNGISGKCSKVNEAEAWRC